MVFLVLFSPNTVEVGMSEDPIRYRIFRRRDGRFIPKTRRREITFTGCNGERHVSYVDHATFDKHGLAVATSVQSSLVVGACDHTCSGRDLGTFTYVPR